jgi:dolichol-phosphate mannosyltransferase
MSHPQLKLSIVCPAYEEEAVLPSFHAELCGAIEGLGANYAIEIIYVDDGSRDGTLDVLRALASTDPRVHYLSLSRNFGHQAALTAGLEHASGDAVISLDSDLQHPPELIPSLVRLWEDGHDVVLTLRQDDPRLGLFKRLTSWAFYKLLRTISATEVRPAAADYRLLSRKAVDALLCLPESHRFLRGMVNWIGFAPVTVPFQPRQRGAGTSKYTLRRMATFATDGLLSFSRVPLRLSFLAGGVSAVLGLAAGVALCARALLGAALLEVEVAAVLVAVLLLGGCGLCCLGILGEYVGRIYEEAKGRPLYLIKGAGPNGPAATRQAASGPTSSVRSLGSRRPLSA